MSSLLDLLGLSGLREQYHPGWPEATPSVILPDGGAVRLRPLSLGDGRAWRQMRLLDEPYLRPVEPTAHGGWDAHHTAAAWRKTYSGLRSMAREGQIAPFAIELDGHFAGQLTLGNIQHGGVSDCWVGYWVFSRFQGRGVATAACALGVDHAFYRVRVHRVTATYLPHNPVSGKVLKTVGFRSEGYLERNLHIDGAWRDHHFVALVKDDYSSSAVARLRNSGRLRRG